MVNKNWILVGDMHLFVFGNMEIQGRYIDEVLAPMVDEDTVLFFSGDQFDENKPIETELVVYIAEKLAPILRRAKHVFMLVGNHDTHKIEDIYKNNNAIFKMLKNVTVVSTVTTVQVDGYSIVMCPYITNHTLLQEELNTRDGDILFCHANIDKILFDNGHSMLKNTLYAENLKKFKLVINGHIHKPQIVDNILNLGSPWQTKYSDRGSDCGIYSFDASDLPKLLEDTQLFETAKLKNTISPRFYKHTYKQILSMPKDRLFSFAGHNLWITESEDNKKIEEALAGVELRNLRIGTVETEQGYVDIDFQHNENIMSEFVPYLNTIKSVQIGEKSVKLTDSYIKELEKISELL